MSILYFLFSIASFLTALFAPISVGLVIFMIFLALIFLIVGTLKILNERLGNQSRTTQHMIDPEELKRYRELADKKKQEKDNS